MFCLLLSNTGIAQQKTYQGKKANYFHPDLQSSFQQVEVFEFEANTLNLAIKSADQFHFNLKMGDQFDWNLNLTYNDMRSADYQEVAITEAGFQILPKRRAITYEGFLNGKHVGEVRMSITDQYIMGFVTDDGQKYFIEPMSFSIPSAPSNLHIVYKPEDVIQDGPMECGVRAVNKYQPAKEEEDHHKPGDGHDHSGLEKAGDCKEVDFLTAATFDMISRYGSVVAVNDNIQTITNIMEPFYAFADIDYIIVQQFVPASNGADPFTASVVAGDLLNSIESWAGGGGISTHDIGQLWVNRDIVGCNGDDPDTNTSLIGCANIGVVCNSNRYNVCEDLNNAACSAILSTHELGHNWDARHSDAGGDNTNIMFPSLNCGSPPTQFGAGEQAVILAHKNSRGCLSDCSVPPNDLCGGAITLACGDNDSSTTCDATAGGDIPICDGGGFPNAGVWYRFFGTDDIVTVSLAGSAFDTQLNVYSGSCGSLTCVGGDDDSGPGTTSQFTFCSRVGTTYYIYVDGFGGTTGTYLITITCTPDVTDPSISCPSNMTMDTDPGVCEKTFNIPGPTSVSDNCDPSPDLDFRFRTNDGMGNTGPWSSWKTNTLQTLSLNRWQIQWRATDYSGNTKRCSYIILIEDNEPPVPVCLDPTVDFNGEDEIFLMVDEVVDLDASSDNCGNVSFVNMSPDKVSCENLGDVIMVTVTVEDENGVQADCISNVTIDGLPCGWSADPDGINCPGGNSADYDVPTMTFFVTSEGCYNPAYYRPTDSHGFATTELCGDGELIAQVTNVAGNGWAGIAMREGTGPSEKMLQLMIDGSFLTRRELRTSTGGTAFAHVFQTQGKNWLRLTRSGNIFGAYHSLDGINWQAILITQIAMNNCIDIGLITMNNAPNGQVTGTFENVTVNGVAPLMQLELPYDIAVNPYELTPIEVFPNPAIDELNVKLPEFVGQSVSINILNVNGQVVKQIALEEVYESTSRIDLNGLENGAYLIRIQGDTNTVSRKFIVNGK